MTDQNPKQKLVFIIGAGRSGTTILSRLSGSVPQCINLGEAYKYLHNMNLQERNLPCGCGQIVSECEFWSEIFSEISLNNVSQKHQLLHAKNFIKLIFFHKKNITLIKEINNDFDLLNSLIRKKTNSALTFIDASKSPSIAFVLNKSQTIDLTCIHLIKDPVGVIASWITPNNYLKSKSFFDACLTWISRNIRSLILKLFFPTIVLDYNRFIENPYEILSKIGLDEYSKSTIFHSNEIILDVQHSLAGNPQKFSSGSIKFEIAKKNLNPFKKILIYIFLWPFYYLIIRLFK